MSGTTNGEFAEHTERYRRELLAHCYRLLGSVHDAEDLVQETYLRAWRGFAGFEGRASVRVWLYQIATNVCLSALTHRTRRVLPAGLGTESATEEVAWLQPMPEILVRSDSDDPAAIVATREGLRLALIASLQYLLPRQRAVLILRDVLGFRAAEVAEMLGVSVAAVKSTLQRARARLSEVGPAADEVLAPNEPAAQRLLGQYIAAFQNADPAALERVLRQDATLEVLPSTTWFAGLAGCMPVIRDAVGQPGDWRMVPTTANGQPAVVAYQRIKGAYRAYGAALLTVTPTGIARITVFGEPNLAAVFGQPLVMPSGTPQRGQGPTARSRAPADR